MSCGATRFLSRIKHMLFFSFSKKHRPFERYKCHTCLWCKYFDDCKYDFDCVMCLDAVSDSFYNGETHAKHTSVVIGEPVESLDKKSIYPEWM